MIYRQIVGYADKSPVSPDITCGREENMAKKSEKLLGTVLVVEDFPVVKEGLNKLLREKLGARTVIEAARFDEAIQALEKNKVNLAIFDLGIPGLRSARELGQVRRKWPNVKVVVLSGSDLRVDILASLEAGVHGYIVKTASLENLANRIGYIMSEEIYVPASLANLDAGVAPAGSGLPFARGAAGDGADRSLLDRLTGRQREVLVHLVDGLGNREIAEKIDRSESMAKAHVAAVVKALGARNRAHAAAIGRALLGARA